MDRKRDVLEGVPALFHTVVDEDVFSAGLKEMTAACHLVVRAYKCNTHADPSVYVVRPGCLFRTDCPMLDSNLPRHFRQDLKMPVVLNLLLFYHERDINRILCFHLTCKILSCRYGPRGIRTQFEVFVILCYGA